MQKFSAFEKKNIFVKTIVFTLALFFILWNVFINPNISHSATTLYYNAAVDNDWGTLGNWWQDAGHTIPADNLPQPDDDVIISADITADVTNSASVANATFSNSTLGASPDDFYLTVSGTATFDGASNNYARIIGEAVFNDNTSSFGTVITGNVTFNGSSGSSNGGLAMTVSGDATFNGSSTNSNQFGANGDVTFNDTSMNISNAGGISAGGNLIFNDSSANGQVLLDPVAGATATLGVFFNDSSQNWGEVFSGTIVMFNSTSINFATGSVLGDACFGANATNLGSVGGATTVCEPLISTLLPADDAIDIAIASNLVITFDSEVTVETGDVTILSAGSTIEAIDVTGGQVTGSGTDEITIDPSSDFTNSTSYYIQIDATAFNDANDNPFAGIADETTWSFTTVAGAPVDGGGGGGGGSSPDKVCEDGLDNDGDLLVDFPNDPGCDSPTDMSEVDPLPACSDGTDNDSDGSIDFPLDLGCSSLTDNDEFNPPPQCSDGIDNDTDGKIDYPADKGCVSLIDNNEVNSAKKCSDGVDNDGDFLVDYPLDPGCSSISDNNEVDPIYACQDGLDNDSDGKIDYPLDPGCSHATDNNEADPIYQCSDGIDNDSDGKIDYPADLGCVSLNDNSETSTIFPPAIVFDCSDGIDNDFDGLVDFPNDPDCVDENDDNEVNIIITLSVCLDGIDNDGDFLVDYPADLGCGSVFDDSEDGPYGSGGGGGGPSGGSSSIVAIIQSFLCTIGLCGNENNNTPTIYNNPQNPNLVRNDTTLVNFDSKKFFTDASYCPPGIVNAAKCIVVESLDYTKEVFGVTFDQAREIIDSPYGNGLTKIIGVTGLIFGAVFTILPILFVNPLSFSEIALIPVRLWSLLASALGLKKRAKKWGVVYDSVTKRPLDPVYISLQDVEGKEITSCITDIDGRYGFLVGPGKYRMLPKKTNYAFPSLKVVGKTRDEIYGDLYFGYVFEIKTQGEVITKNIPMDPKTFDWNEYAKKEQELTRFFSKRDMFLNRIADVTFSLGMFFAAIAAISAPIGYNLAILGLYLVLMIFREYGLRQKKSSTLLKKGTDIPLAYAIVRIFEAKSKQEIAQKVTDRIGKFFALVRKGEYYITVEEKLKNGNYKKVFTSEVVDIKDGIIEKVFNV